MKLHTERMLHGGDYNPEQWLHMPEIIDEDFDYFPKARCNTMSVGIFSWAMYEPKEGKYQFEWMDAILDRLHSQGMQAILATPSGARPAWLAEKYPEVLRVQPDGQRNLWGARHNHCYTSPVYREKVQALNNRLAERYAGHPAVLLWHLSNEYGGECHCELCQDAFKQWLKDRYNNDLEALNRSYWSRFWSHSYSSWDQIHSPAPHGEMGVHGLTLDWKRFVTHQTVDFMKHEIASVRSSGKELPVTTNLMGTYPVLDYWKLVPHLDVVSWDSYPLWHRPGGTEEEPAAQAFIHDMNRSFKGNKPFLLMESTPSFTNWQPVARMKQPGMHLAASLQAVAHGSDSVLYFQWRQSRGSCEKFHGAVVEHSRSSETKAFKDVAQLGKALEKLSGVIGATPEPEGAVLFDWENMWAIEGCQGFKKEKEYTKTVIEHYTAFWKQGVSMAVIDSEQDFSSYKVIAAPMLYMLKPGVARRLKDFVAAGGILIGTYLTGITDESDLCFLGGWPGPLKEVFGVWNETMESLGDETGFTLSILPEHQTGGFEEHYETKDFCAVLHSQGAETIGVYKDCFFRDTPALTRNGYGDGTAWYIAPRTGQDFLNSFYARIIQEAGIKKCISADLPFGVSAVMRKKEDKEYLFVLNFSGEAQTISAPEIHGRDLVGGAECGGSIDLPDFGAAVIERVKM